MGSIKIVLRKEIKSDGTSPLALRVTKDRKSSYIYLGYALKPSDWNSIEQKVKKSHPNSTRLNNYLTKKLAEANDNVLQVETDKPQISVRSLREKIKPSTVFTFFPQADMYLDQLRNAGKYNQYTADKPRIGHFKDFVKSDIGFKEITIGLLDRFVVYLKSSYIPKRGGPKIGERTIANHLVAIRSVFAFARKNDVIEAGLSPFGKSKISIKFGETQKRGITVDELKRMEEVRFNEPFDNHCRNLWLFSFYLAGMRISDVLRLRWADIRDNRLQYTMGKNKKVTSMRIPEQALAILEQYRTSKTTHAAFVFPELRLVNMSETFFAQRSIAFKTSSIDKCLRTRIAPAVGIHQPLTMHIARHTFASLAGDAIPIQMLQKLYRHAHVSTTIGYQQSFTSQDTDAALDMVIGKTK